MCRLLTADDIELRVAQTTERDGVISVNLLLYKNARIDMKILDELYGPLNWQRKHEMKGDRLYCTVSVLNTETREWIAKEDVGTESNTEPEKGQASDAFKRACTNWGIGRELYTAPKNIKITLQEGEYTKGNNGQVRVWQRFYVDHIAYDEKERKITELRIVDAYGVERYDMGKRPGSKKAALKAKVEAASVKKQPTPAAAPAPAPAPAKKSLSSLSDNVYKAWVAAVARKDTMSDGTPAFKALVAKFNPSADELNKFNNAVFTYSVQEGIED